MLHSLVHVDDILLHMSDKAKHIELERGIKATLRVAGIVMNEADSKN